MESRWLGRSGIQVSPLGLGTARLAGLGWQEDLAPAAGSTAVQDAVRQLQAAVDLVVTLFDTADTYGQGWSERILAEVLCSRREQTAKLHLPVPQDRQTAIPGLLEVPHIGAPTYIRTPSGIRR